MPDLGATLAPVLAALTIAARSLSRELAGQTVTARVDAPIPTSDPTLVAAAGS